MRTPMMPLLLTLWLVVPALAAQPAKPSPAAEPPGRGSAPALPAAACEPSGVHA